MLIKTTFLLIFLNHGFRTANAQDLAEVHLQVQNDENINESLDETFYRTEREYHYLYDSQFCTGLPQQSSQFGSTRFLANVTLYFPAETSALLKIVHIRLGQTNGAIPEYREIQPMDYFEQKNINDEYLSTFYLPVQFSYIDGLISDVLFDRNDKPWFKNFKRGILNMLQINMRKKQQIERNERLNIREQHQCYQCDRAYENADFFTSQEKTVEGDCEVQYTFNRNFRISERTAASYPEITKSINLQKCRKRVVIRYGDSLDKTPSEYRCENDHRETSTDSSTVFNYQILGDWKRFTIRKASVQSHHLYTSIGENIMGTFITGQLELQRISERRYQYTLQDYEKSETLQYSTEREAKVEHFTMFGDENFDDNLFHYSSSKYEEIENTIENLQRSSIYHGKKSKLTSDAPIHMMRLVGYFKMCSKEEITKLYKNYFESDTKFNSTEISQRTRDLMLDTLATAGTQNTIEFIVQKIESGEITPLKAINLLPKFANVHLTSTKQVDAVLELCKKRICNLNPVLQRACFLSAGGMVNKLCTRYTDIAPEEYEENCPPQIKEKYLDELLKIHEKSNLRYEKILRLKALGNAGLKISLPSIERSIRDENEEVVVRIQAIESIRKFRDVMPQKVRKILIPYFLSDSEDPELRMSALQQIMATLPERSVLDQISQKLSKERSRQVAAYASTMLHSMATSKNPFESRTAQDIMQSMHYTRVLKANWTESSYYHFPFYSNLHHLGLNLGISSMFTKETMLPRHMMLNLDTMIAGKMRRSAAQIGIVQYGAEKLMQEIFENPTADEVSLRESLMHADYKSKPIASINMLKAIYRKLNVKGRSINKDIHGFIYTRFNDMDTGFVSLNQESISIVTEILRNGKLNLEKLTGLFTNNYSLKNDFTSLYHLSRRTTTCLGIPIIIDRNVVTVGGLNLDTELDFRSTHTSGLHDARLSIKGLLHGEIAHSTYMRICSPLVYSGIRMIQSAQFNAPLDISSGFKVGEKNEMKLNIKMPNEQQSILEFHTKTSIITSNWPNNEQNYEQREETVRCDLKPRQTFTTYRTFGENIFGWRYNLRSSCLGTPCQYLLLSPMASIADENFFTLDIVPSRLTPNEIVMDFNYLFEAKELIKEIDVTRFERITRIKKIFEIDQEEDEESIYLTSDGNSALYGSTELKETVVEQTERREEFIRYITTYKNGRGYHAEVNFQLQTLGPAQDRVGEINVGADCDEEFGFCTINFNGRRSPVLENERVDWVFKSILQTLRPQKINSLEDLKHQKHREFTGHWDCNWGSEQIHQLNITFQGEQDHAQRKILAQYFSNKSMSNTMQIHQNLNRATQLNKYKIAITYNELDRQLQSYANSVYDFLKTTMYWNTQIERTTQEESGIMIARMTFHPVIHKQMSMKIETSNEITQIHSIRLPLDPSIFMLNMYNHRIAVRSLRHLVRNALTDDENTECWVSSQHIRTFDGAEVKLPLTTCYSLLAKDCRSERPNFAVLIRKIHKSGTNEMKIKIVDRQNTIEVELIDNKFVVYVDGELFTDSEQSISKGIKVKEGIVVVDLDDVFVRFDGFSISLRISPYYKNGQCGLCGHYDGEIGDEFRKSDNEIATSLEDYHRSYLYSENDCDMDEKTLSDQKNYYLFNERLAEQFVRMTLIERKFVIETYSQQQKESIKTKMTKNQFDTLNIPANK